MKTCTRSALSTVALRSALAGLLAASGIQSCSPTGESRAVRPPNVVIVVLDTLRPDYLGCYGHERDTTPHLDAISDEFFLFENAQSCAPWTAPSLVSLMTALYPDVHGVTDYPNPGRMSERITTLAEVLRESGYATAAFTEGGYARAEFGLGQGFDSYAARRKEDSDLVRPGRLRENIGDALGWLEEHRDEPFFLFFHTYVVHSPLNAPEEYVRFFRPEYDERQMRAEVQRAIQTWKEGGEIAEDDLALLRDFSFRVEPTNSQRRGETPLRKELLKAISLASTSPQCVAWVRDLYDAQVRYADAELSRLWAALAEPELRESTIVVLTSDHGEGLGEHGQMGHGRVLFEEALRVLLMIRMPGMAPPPRRIPDLVRSVDVMPTLLELASIPTEGLEMQGRSLMPLMRGAHSEQPAFAHALLLNGGRKTQHSIRLGHWRLIVDSGTGEVSLFDLRSDPDEHENVTEAYPDVTKSLLEHGRHQQARDRTLRRRLAAEPQAGELDADALRDLRGLGYVGDND